MADNVWEWTRSLWGKDTDQPSFAYPYFVADGRENLQAPDDVLRVLRGGAFDNSLPLVRCAVRLRGGARDAGYYVGFRVVLSLLP